MIKEDFGVTNKKLILENYIKYSSFNNDYLVENTYTENSFFDLFQKDALEFSKDKIYEKNFNDTIRIKSQLVNREYSKPKTSCQVIHLCIKILFYLQFPQIFV